MRADKTSGGKGNACAENVRTVFESNSSHHRACVRAHAPACPNHRLCRSMRHKDTAVNYSSSASVRLPSLRTEGVHAHGEELGGKSALELDFDDGELRLSKETQKVVVAAGQAAVLLVHDEAFGAVVLLHLREPGRAQSQTSAPGSPPPPKRAVAHAPQSSRPSSGQPCSA